MTILPATKGASLSSLHLVCVAAWFYASECPSAENVTSCRCDVTPRDARRKAKIYMFTRENDKNNSKAQRYE